MILRQDSSLTHRDYNEVEGEGVVEALGDGARVNERRSGIRHPQEHTRRDRDWAPGEMVAGDGVKGGEGMGMTQQREIEEEGC